MSIENKNLPAFPVEVSVDGNGNLTGSSTSPFSSFEIGLTKREYFAAKAMQGIMANETTNPASERHFDYRATQAIKMADALLKALEQKENTEDQQ
jgi:hypothetical protein